MNHYNHGCHSFVLSAILEPTLRRQEWMRRFPLQVGDLRLKYLLVRQRPFATGETAACIEGSPS
jgi:hypothetical protein